MNFLKRQSRNIFLTILAAALTGSLAYAAALISAQYHVPIQVVSNGAATSASAHYSVQNGTIGQTLFGRAQSGRYQNAGGFSGQAAALANSPAANLGDAYVYPNPFKPNSSGSFQAAKITFKHLPAEAHIRVFAITGRLVAEIHKTDRTVDYYEWNPVNDEGQKLASGVYIFYLTAPGGGKSRGKFAIIR